MISMWDKYQGNTKYTFKNYLSLLGNNMDYISTTAFDVINSIFSKAIPCCFWSIAAGIKSLILFFHMDA